MFENDYLMHHGIKGQKWGVRRYQNSDGSLTAAGRARYSKGNGSRARYGSDSAYGSQLDPKTAKKVNRLNKAIDNENLWFQSSHATRQALKNASTAKSTGRAALKTGLASAAVAGGIVGASTKGSIKKKLKNAAIAGGGLGLVGGVSEAAGNIVGMKLGKHDINKEGPTSKLREKRVQDLIALRNELDPSQRNRKGRALTKEEYSNAYNYAMNALYRTGKYKDMVSDDQYNKYLQDTPVYGSKKNAKYGSQLDPKTAKRVEELNKQIDKENLKLQKRNARSYGYDQASLKKAAAAGAVTGAAINAASARTNGRFAADLMGYDQAGIDSIGRSSAIRGGIGGAALGAGTGALKGAAIKAIGKSSAGKTSRESKLNRMIAERNELDPSQASRKGRTLTEKEFNRQVNAAKGATLGGSATPILLSPIGAAVGSAVGSRSAKGRNTYDYNDYLKNTTTYGSKKKRR